MLNHNLHNTGLFGLHCHLEEAWDKHRIYWEEPRKKVRGPLLEFCGTPFVILGSVGMDCQYGRDRHAAEKRKRKRATSAEVTSLDSNHHHHLFTPIVYKCGEQVMSRYNKAVTGAFRSEVLRCVLLSCLTFFHVNFTDVFGDRLEGKGENYQVCSVQYCVQQLCTVRCTHI